MYYGYDGREYEDAEMDAMRRDAREEGMEQAARKPLPVIMEDVPVHVLPDRPFCDDPECPCHDDDELFMEFIERPMTDGLLTSFEAVRILWNEVI